MSQTQNDQLALCNATVFTTKQDGNGDVDFSAVRALCIKIIVLTWNEHISLRADVKVDNVLQTNDEDRRQYSSIFGHNDETRQNHSRSTLQSPQAWSAENKQEGEWMQINMSTIKCVTGLRIQARSDAPHNHQYIKTFRLMYSEDGCTWMPIIAWREEIIALRQENRLLRDEMRSLYLRGKRFRLHNRFHNRFVRLIGDSVDAGEGVRDVDQLPADSEIFRFVDAGEGQFALHNSQSNRFVRLWGDFGVDAGGGVRDVNQLPPANDWPLERFTVVDAGNGQIALHNRFRNRFVRLNGDSVDTRGGAKDVDQLPATWGSERFTLVIVY